MDTIKLNYYKFNNALEGMSDLSENTNTKIWNDAQKQQPLH